MCPLGLRLGQSFRVSLALRVRRESKLFTLLGREGETSGGKAQGMSWQCQGEQQGGQEKESAGSTGVTAKAKIRHLSGPRRGTQGWRKAEDAAA